MPRRTCEPQHSVVPSAWSPHVALCHAVAICTQSVPRGLSQESLQLVAMRTMAPMDVIRMRMTGFYHEPELLLGSTLGNTSARGASGRARKSAGETRVVQLLTSRS